MAAKFTLGEFGDLLDAGCLDSESSEYGGEEVYGYLSEAVSTAADFAALGEAVGADSDSDGEFSGFDGGARLSPAGASLSPCGGEMGLEDPVSSAYGSESDFEDAAGDPDHDNNTLLMPDWVKTPDGVLKQRRRHSVADVPPSDVTPNVMWNDKESMVRFLKSPQGKHHVSNMMSTSKLKISPSRRKRRQSMPDHRLTFCIARGGGDHPVHAHREKVVGHFKKYRKSNPYNPLSRPSSSATLLEPHVYRLTEDGRRQEKLRSLKVGDVLTGSGLTDGQEPYSREAHRKRALDMYRHSSQLTSPTAATNPAAAATSLTSISAEDSHSFIQQTYPAVSRENSISASPQTGTVLVKSASTGNPESPFSLIMETFQLYQPRTVEVKVTPKDSSSNTARLKKHKISVSGNYIPSPPERLSFARRSGNFNPSATGMDLRTQKTSAVRMPHLRILKDGEEANPNF